MNLGQYVAEVARLEAVLQERCEAAGVEFAPQLLRAHELATTTVESYLQTLDRVALEVLCGRWL